MKQLAIAIAFLALAVGCSGQVPPNPTSYSCPSSSGTAYTPLNQSSPTTSLTYTDSKPSAAVYCYIAQSVAGSQVSVPSNTAGPFTVATGQSVQLSWTAPTTGTVPTGYVLSRAPAVSSTINPPALGSGSVAENRPEPNPNWNLALAIPLQLKGSRK